MVSGNGSAGMVYSNTKNILFDCYKNYISVYGLDEEEPEIFEGCYCQVHRIA